MTAETTIDVYTRAAHLIEAHYLDGALIKAYRYINGELIDTITEPHPDNLRTVQWWMEEYCMLEEQ